MWTDRLSLLPYMSLSLDFTSHLYFADQHVHLFVLILEGDSKRLRERRESKSEEIYRER